MHSIRSKVGGAQIVRIQRKILLHFLIAKQLRSCSIGCRSSSPTDTTLQQMILKGSQHLQSILQPLLKRLLHVHQKCPSPSRRSLASLYTPSSKHTSVRLPPAVAATPTLRSGPHRGNEGSLFWVTGLKDPEVHLCILAQFMQPSKPGVHTNALENLAARVPRIVCGLVPCYASEMLIQWPSKKANGE